MNATAEPLTFTVPLSFAAHAIARRYQHPARARQSYLKGLAVYAVDFYLRCLGFTPDPERSDWRIPWLANLIDVADLWLHPQGKLECCLVMPDAQQLQIPLDAWEDRIAYVAIQLEPTLKWATLLGFTPIPVAELRLTELRSLSEFPDYLHQLQPSPPMSDLDSAGVSRAAFRSPPNKTPDNTPKRVACQPIVNLRSWLDGTMTPGWQSLETALGIDQIRMIAVRGSDQFAITVRQAKLLDVGLTLGEQAVVLTLAISVNPDTSMNVLVQTHPAAGLSCLPPNLNLAMLSDRGEVLQDVTSRNHDRYIQLKPFRGEAGDSFDIQVSLDHVSVTESFIL